MRISDWSSDVCSSDLLVCGLLGHRHLVRADERRRGQSGEVILGEAGLDLLVGLALVAGQGVGLHSEERQQRGAGVQIGRASCRESVCQYVSISGVAVSLKKKNYTPKQ